MIKKIITKLPNYRELDWIEKVLGRCEESIEFPKGEIGEIALDIINHRTVIYDGQQWRHLKNMREI
jgi:hypothetical protein